MTYQNPYTKEELQKSIIEYNADVINYFQAIPIEKFFVKKNGWSPAENARHLITTSRIVTIGLHFPKWMLSLFFGKPSAKSRELIAVREAYFAELTKGAGAGIFTPLSIANPDANDKREKERKQLLAGWQKAAADLAAAIDDYTESDLENIRLPHTVMGLISIREMLIFALLHEQHHLANVKKKLA